MVIPSAFVLYTIVAVGVLGVGVPVRYGPDLSVLVCHNNMGFPSSFRCQFEGHIGESPHVRLTAFAHLHELQITSYHLVVGSVTVPVLHHLAILPDLEGTNRLVGVKIPFSRL